VDRATKAGQATQMPIRMQILALLETGTGTGTVAEMRTRAKLKNKSGDRNRGSGWTPNFKG